MRVTVADQAGNSGTGTNTANTRKPEKNPGGVINNIVSGEINFANNDNYYGKSRVGKQVNFHFTPRTATMGATLKEYEGRDVQ